jgi:dihydrofolate reductase
LTFDYRRAPWRNFFRDFFSTFCSEPYVANDEWRRVAGPSDRPRGDTPAGSGTVTPTPEATQAATSKATSHATGQATGATGERDIDPSNPARTVPKKKANSPFLVHQRWKEEQEMRRRKAAERDSSGGSDSSKSDKKGKGKSGRSSDGGEETTDLSGAVGVIVKLVRFAIMSVAIAMVTGLFVAGDPLWGYRGKYTKLRTYLPVSVLVADGGRRKEEHRADTTRFYRVRNQYREKIFSLPELAMYNGRDEKKPIYVSALGQAAWYSKTRRKLTKAGMVTLQIAILGDVYDVTEGRRIYGPGGYYSFFSGRDASRAYVTGCFKTHLTYDVRDFDDQQMSVSTTLQPSETRPNKN